MTIIDYYIIEYISISYIRRNFNIKDTSLSQGT